MAAVTISMTKFIAGIVIAILASSAISIGVSTQLAAGPQGPEGPKGDTGPHGPAGSTGATEALGAQGPQDEPGIGFEPTGYISVPAAAFSENQARNICFMGKSTLMIFRENIF